MEHPDFQSPSGLRFQIALIIAYNWSNGCLHCLPHQTLSQIHSKNNSGLPVIIVKMSPTRVVIVLVAPVIADMPPDTAS